MGEQQGNAVHFKFIGDGNGNGEGVLASDFATGNVDFFKYAKKEQPSEKRLQEKKVAHEKKRTISDVVIEGRKLQHAKPIIEMIHEDDLEIMIRFARKILQEIEEELKKDVQLLSATEEEFAQHLRHNMDYVSKQLIADNALTDDAIEEQEICDYIFEKTKI